MKKAVGRDVLRIERARTRQLPQHIEEIASPTAREGSVDDRTMLVTDMARSSG